MSQALPAALLDTPADYPPAYEDVCRRFLAAHAEQFVRIAARDHGYQLATLAPEELDRTHLAAQLAAIAHAAVGSDGFDYEQHADQVRAALSALKEILFAWPGMPADYAEPAAFWETPLGHMVAAAYIWLDRDDLITITEAAELTGLSLWAITSRIRRGQLTAYPDHSARNPQRGGRLVRRNQVLASKKDR